MLQIIFESLLSSSHSEDAGLCLADGSVQRRDQTQADHSAQVASLDDAVVPQATRRVVGLRVRVVLFNDVLFEFLCLFAVLALELDESQDFAGLSATHHRDLSAWQHVHEVW